MDILVDFKVMGLDEKMNEYLNWCMEKYAFVDWARQNYGNLEFLHENKTLNLKSTNATLHFSDVGRIELIERKEYDRRGA